MVSLWSLAHGCAVLECPPNHDLFLACARPPAIGFGVTQSVFLGTWPQPVLQFVQARGHWYGVGCLTAFIGCLLPLA